MPSLVYASPSDFVTYADIDDNIISDCGRLDFEYAGGQNGEGICEQYYLLQQKSDYMRQGPATTRPSKSTAFKSYTRVCIWL